MKKILFGLSTAALAFIVGCASEPAIKQTDTGSQVAAIDANLSKLRSLNVFEVDRMIEHWPAGVANCYNLPCSEADRPAIEREHALQAERLAKLAELAARAVGAPKQANACEQPTIDANLDKLRALDIVEVGSLVVEQPKSSASCYNLPCPSDVEAAHQTTCERADDLAAIVDATKGM